MGLGDHATLVADLGEEAFCQQFRGGDAGYCYPAMPALVTPPPTLPSGAGGKDRGDTSDSAVTLCEEEVLGGLRMPMFAIHAGDGSNR